MGQAIKFEILQARDQALTSFEWRVLKLVSRIPLGQTRSYAWVARRLNQPKAARAVGRALSKNPFPLIIPCHRVVKKNGVVGGFAFGVQAKKKLLKVEKQIAQRFCQKSF